MPTIDVIKPGDAGPDDVLRMLLASNFTKIAKDLKDQETRATLLVLRADGQPRGFAEIRFYGPDTATWSDLPTRVLIHELWVEPDHRNQGFGAHMLLASLEAGAQHGCIAVILTASPGPGLQDRLRFFKTCGLTLDEDGELKMSGKIKDVITTTEARMITRCADRSES